METTHKLTAVGKTSKQLQSTTQKNGGKRKCAHRVRCGANAEPHTRWLRTALPRIRYRWYLGIGKWIERMASIFLCVVADHLGRSVGRR